MSQTNTAVAVTGIRTVGIPVVDQDRALKFYAAHAALRPRGVDADDVLRWPGVPPMFAFRDQDGNGLEIVEARTPTAGCTRS